MTQTLPRQPKSRRPLSRQRVSEAQENSVDEIQHFVMEDASWELYEKFLKDIGDRPVRVTYDEGRMEIMSPLPEHDWVKTFIGSLIQFLAFELNTPILSWGSTTFRRRDKEKGLEPDECFYFRDEPRMRGKKRVNLRKDPPPELVVEVEVTSRSVPREPIYAALGVPEMWRVRGEKIQCLHLIGDQYQIRKMSLAFPFLEPASLNPFIRKAAEVGQTAALRQFVTWIRKNGWTDEGRE
jgi:Uma2 family endonuclease